MIITIGGGIQEMIDFTDCEINLTENYGGSDQKGVLFTGMSAICLKWQTVFQIIRGMT